MTKPLLAILLLLPLSVSAGGLDGKQIFCDSKQAEPRGYTFYSGRVTEDILRIRGLEVFFEREGQGAATEYQEWPTRVDWHQSHVIYRLNRQSLELKAEKLSADRKNISYQAWQCQSYQDIDEYRARLKQAISERQAGIKKEMSDNKI